MGDADRMRAAGGEVRVAAAAPTGAATLARSVVLKFAIYGANALTGIITARALQPDGRGELAAMTLWPVVLAGATTIGLPSALVFHTSRDPARTPALVTAAFAISLVSGLLGTAVGWVMVPWWLGTHPPSIVRAAQFCLLATVVYSLTVIARAVWEAQGRLDRSHVLQLISPAVTIAALLPQVAWQTLTPIRAAATYVLAGVPTLLWSLRSVLRVHPLSWSHVGESWRRLLHYGGRSYGVDLAAVLAGFLDQALVVGLLAPAAMGLYVVALSLSRVINAVQGSVAVMAFPRMVGLDRPLLGEAIGRAARLSALATGGLAAVVALGGGVLVTMLYGPAFRAAGPLLRILVLEVVLGGIAQVLLQAFMAAGRPSVATAIQLFGLALSVPVFLVLVPAYGATGAAVGLLLATVGRLLLTLAAYPVFLGIPTPRVWIDRGDVAELFAYRTVLFGPARLRAGGAQ